MNGSTANVGVRVVVGMDLVAVDRMRESVTAFGDRFLRRVFTAREIAHCEQFAGSSAVERFAARFAAKEATIKVLRPERGWFDPRWVEVVSADSGAPDVVLHGDAVDMAERAHIASLSLSISHEGDMAAAIVVGVVNARSSDGSDSSTRRNDA